MPHPFEIDWPDDETLLRELWAAGSYRAYADQIGGIAPTTIQSHLGRRGLLKRYLDGKPLKKLAAHKAKGAPPDPADLLQQELRETRRALSASHGEDVREERVIRAIQGAVEARKPLYRPARLKAGARREHHFVLLWSDAHAGEVVEPSAVGGMNAYNWEIMLDRHQEIFKAVSSYVQHRNYGIGKLYVAALGDGLSGNIHEELRETNEIPLAEATVQFGLDSADWLEQFLELFPSIHFTGVVGNHPRESLKPKAKRKFSNADWTAYQVMKQRLRRQNAITFDIPKASRQRLEVFNRQLLLFHGDAVGPSSMVGVPWGGIIRHVGRLRNQYAGMGLGLDHFLCGHFHEANCVANKRIIINGSIVGASEYGLEKFGEASPPTQVLLTFNANHGLVDVSFLQLKAGLPT